MYLNTNNQKMYGGANKKQGLPPTVGLGRFTSNLIQRKAGYCRCIPTSTFTTTQFYIVESVFTFAKPRSFWTTSNTESAVIQIARTAGVPLNTVIVVSVVSGSTILTTQVVNIPTYAAAVIIQDRLRNIVFKNLGAYTVTSVIIISPGPTPTPICPSNEITIPNDTVYSTQTDLNTLDGVTKIIGSLIISNFAGEPDFNVFQCLNEITGDFLIENNVNLTTISGFLKLQTVGGSFDFNTNEALTSISDFPALETIGGFFTINTNNELTTISAFSALTTVGSVFSLSSNAKLKTINQFSALKSVGLSPTSADKYFRISRNAKLTTISDFTKLETVGGDFRIFTNGSALTGNINSVVTIIESGAFDEIISITGTSVELIGVSPVKKLQINNATFNTIAAAISPPNVINDAFLYKNT